MGISRSTYYYKPKGGRPSDTDLDNRIEKIALQYPSCGYRRITAEIRPLKVNHKKGYRLMRQESLLCRTRKAFKATTNSAHNPCQVPQPYRRPGAL